MTVRLKRLIGAFAMLCVLSAHSLIAQTSSSMCYGDNILLYSATTGAGITGKLSSTGFTVDANYPAGSFSPGWTQVAQVDTSDSLIFYNSSTGSAAIGALNQGVFTTTQSLNLPTGLTNILYAGLSDNSVSLPLAYNATNGSGEVGIAPPERVYGAGSFAAGWTHIVWDGANILFYNKNTGAGAVVIPTPASPMNPTDVNNLSTTKGFQAGSFSRWTNITVLGGEIVFYNSANGSAAVGRLIPALVGGANNFVTDNVYPANYFGPQWTHVIGTTNNLALFYNSATGNAAVVKMFLPGASSPFPPSAGIQFQTVAVIPHGLLPAGFTHAACSEDAPPNHPPA